MTAIIPIIDFPRHATNISIIIKNAQEINLDLVLVLDSQPQSIFEQTVSTIDSLGANAVVVEVNSRNPGGARNMGLSLAKTEWVVFWDCDDMPYAANMLKMIMRADGSGTQVVIGNYEEEELRSGKIKSTSDISKFWKIDVGLNPGIWRFAFKRDLIGSTRFPDLKMGEDQVFLQRILAKSPKVQIYNEIVYRYRLGVPNQLTSNRHEMSDLIFSNVITKRELNEQSIYKDTVITMLIRQLLTLSKVPSFKVRYRLVYFFGAVVYLTKKPIVIFRFVNLHRVRMDRKESLRKR
jgi:glycosyltransferase involved in cell wall biosynthesis